MNFSVGEIVKIKSVLGVSKTAIGALVKITHIDTRSGSWMPLKVQFLERTGEFFPYRDYGADSTQIERICGKREEIE